MKNIKISASKEYDVIIGKGLLELAGEYIKKAAPEALKAAVISDEEITKIEDGLFNIFKIYSDYKKIKELSETEIKNIVKWFSSAIINQFDIYITHKKEIVRQNPEAGAGSLFALPTDDTALNSIIKLVEQYISHFEIV